MSHSDEDLINKVVEGRKKEFDNVDWYREPLNPQEETTFDKSKLDWTELETGKYRIMLEWSRALIKLRKSSPALKNFNENDVRFYMINDKAFVLRRAIADQQVEVLSVCILSDQTVAWSLPNVGIQWKVLPE